ncbi:MAG: choice-of-anchor J domain-containing protein, partial [Lachnospiraceae bacterium]|nr:choice-of-anchor J domain-containing protein [Lachnospiraceae bacterium]
MNKSRKKRMMLGISGILLALVMVLSNFTGLYPAMEAKAATCRIDVYTEGLEMGTVTGQGNYNSGNTVTLTAYPSPGYDFICWADYSLGEVYYDNPLKFTATESREIDVIFKKQGEYFIYVPSHDEGAVNVNPLKSSYAPGETVYLSATTNTNYAVDTFLLREEGQEEYTEIGNSFTMPRNNVFVSARFRSTVPHTITIDPNMQHGTFTLLDGKTSYMQGETVRLSVNPEKGYRLTGISGIPAVYTYADGVFTFQMMGQDLMISGTFEKRTMFQVTVGVFPENGGTVDFNQTETGFLTMSAKANDGYVFAGYYDYTNQVKGKLLSKDVDYSKQLTEDVEILAVFDRVVSIKHSTYPLDVGTTTVAYDANKKQIVATVVPNEGYVFKYWFAVPSMEIIGREPTLYFDPGAYEQIAAYCKEPATSNLYLMSTQNGTISVVNYKTTYLEGEEIEIAVTPDPGYVLENAYYGVLVDHTLKEAKYIVDNKFMMPGKDTWIYATFVRKSSYDVTATASLSEGGTVTGGGTYLPDETVTLTATANGGYEFINWTENGEEVSTSATYEFTATMDRVLVANFKKKEIVYENYFLEEFGPCLPEGWTFVNSDGDDYGWTYIWAPLYTGGHYAGSGEFALSSASMYGGRLLSADEWAITPAIIAPQNAKLSFLITEHIESYEPDNMSVYVGLSPEIDKMTKLADFSVRAREMKRCEVNLAAYDGQKIYVGFRHYNSVGAIVLLLDDVEVSSGEAILTDENLAITKRSLTLFDTITIDFKVPAEAVAAYHDPYLMVTQNGEETKLTTYREDGGFLIFSYRVPPQAMGDVATAVPH